MSAGFSWNQRNTGGHRPPLQQTEPLFNRFATSSRKEGNPLLMKRICVFCGSSAGRNPVYLDTARAMGKALVRRGIGLVYGGGRVGLMGAIADTVLSDGGEVIGCIPQPMVAREVAHHGVTELRVVHSMH